MIQSHDLIDSIEAEKVKNRWQSSFLDIMLLLLSFFVIILGISKFDNFMISLIS